jgi:hypothetical protein
MKVLKRYFNPVVWFSVMVLSTFISGCNGNGSGNDMGVAPTVISTNPVDAVTTVARNRNITATFSTEMDAATITTSTFTLTGPGSTPVAGSVTYSGTTAIFNPTSDLGDTVLYTATITTGAKNVAGTALAANHVWTFTTGSTSDSTAPIVLSTDPDSNATGVAINQNITAIFSEAVEPTTVSALTFTVTGPGVTPVAGIVSSVGSTVTFNPTSDLIASTTYTATLTTGITDLAENPLAANHVWTFTTGTGLAQGPAPVPLGLAGNYAIFTNTGISNATPPAAIIGNMGTGPGVTSTAITGFALIAAGDHATSTQVTGNVYAFDYADPTPENVTTASIDMGLAYDNAAGRLLPDFSELAGGNLGGQTLVPGLYKWTSGVTLPVNTTVTLSGGPNDVWIFQISGTLVAGANTNVLLLGGAQPKNIFWQVAGASVTLGADSHFEGVVLAKSAISFGNKTSANSRLLAQTRVNLDENNVTQPGL